MKTRILITQREKKMMNKESGVVELLYEHHSESNVNKEKLLRLLKKDKEENSELSFKAQKKNRKLWKGELGIED